MDKLQDIFLERVMKDAIPITVYLMSGFQIRGEVKGFDPYTIILETGGKQQMIYKHAISTISPSMSIDLQIVNKGE